MLAATPVPPPAEENPPAPRRVVAIRGNDPQR
jgi:hypothetical protein